MPTDPPLTSGSSMEAPATTEPSAVKRGDGGEQRAAARDLTLPNLIIIGAQKAGTSDIRLDAVVQAELLDAMPTPTSSSAF